MNLSGKYYLTCDIEFSEEDFEPGGAFYNDGAGWLPIGGSIASPFSGTFDGNGHTIRNLTVNHINESTAYLGLFGVVSGTICNLSVSGNVCIASSSNTYSGALAGYVYNGTVTRCSSDAVVSVETAGASSYVGGLFGSVRGTVSECCFTGSLSLSSQSSTVYVGSISGNSVASTTKISDCYSSVIPTVAVGEGAECYVGGIVGNAASSSVISTSFTSAKIAVSGNPKNTLTDCYSALSLTEAQMSDPSTFSGFDFVSVWKMGSLPCLRNLPETSDAPAVFDLILTNAQAFVDGAPAVSAKAGDTVTVSPILAAGQRFESWTVSGISPAPVASEFSFVMPEHAVTISANLITYQVIASHQTSLTVPTIGSAIPAQETFFYLDPAGYATTVIYSWQISEDGETYRAVERDAVFVEGYYYRRVPISSVQGDLSEFAADGAFFFGGESLSAEAYAQRLQATAESLFDPQGPLGTPLLLSISVYTLPETSVLEGVGFSADGMILTLHYNDGTIGSASSGWTLQGFDPALLGEQTVTVIYEGKETSFVVTVLAKSLESISVETTPKVSYLEGESFDPTGLTVKLHYDNGTSDLVDSGFSVTGYDASVIGTQTLTVAYGGKTTTLTVTVLAKSLESISIETAPKTSYLEGESFDPSGLTVKLHYNNGTSDLVDSGFTVTGYDASVIGQQTLTVSFGGKTTTLTATVLAKSLESISVETSPKVSYLEGESFDPFGLVVKLHYDNGTSDLVDNGFTVTGYDASVIGPQTLTISYGGKSATLTITVLAKSLESISVETTPKVSYLEGESFDSTGLTVKLQYNNGTSDLVDSGFTVTGYDASVIGPQTLTISYGGKTSNLTVTVLAKSLESISIETAPKTSYLEGESFDSSGLVVKLHYDNGTTDLVDNGFTVTGYDASVIGPQTLTISYSGKTTTLTVTVLAKSLESISIEAAPKVSYLEGEAFDPSGLTIKLHYDNGTSDLVDSGFTVTGYDASVIGQQTLTVFYGGKTTNLTVTVLAKSLESISVETAPKVSYLEGEFFDPSGLVVKLHYDNGTSDLVDSGFTVTGYDVSVIGQQTLTVAYGGKTTSLPITVLAKSLESISVKTPPKTVYVEGETFSDFGMELILHYNNGDTLIVTTGWDPFNADISSVGRYTLTVSYEGKSAPLTVTVIAKTLVGISVKTPPRQTYFAGEAFDDSEMVLTLHYDNGTVSDLISGWTVLGFDSDLLGTQILTVLYAGKETSLSVTVSEVVLESISVHTPPELTYIEGLEFDDLGMILTLHYSDGSTAQISSGWSISGYDPLITGEQVLTVSYEGKSASLSVQVLPKTLASISVKQPPKTAYFENQSFSTEGMALTLHYNNGTEETITSGWSLSGFDSSKIGQQTVTVSYGGKQTTLSVSVAGIVLQAITVEVAPNLQYLEGSSFCDDGMVLRLHYNDGTSRLVSEGWTVSGYDGSIVGRQSVTVTCDGASVLLTVTVIAKSLTEISVGVPPVSSYLEGAPFCDDGMTLILHYDNGTTQQISAGWTIVGYDPYDVGEQTLTVSYAGESTSLTVTVIAKSLSEIILEAPPKTSYLQGIAFDDDGMVLRLVYDNGTSELVSDGWMISGFDPDHVGTQSVTVTYAGKTLSLSVNVIERSLTHITVATPPQTVYVEGLPFDSSKMRLTLHYDNGTCETVSQGWTVSGFDPTLLGAQTVTVSYADRTVEIAVSVIAKSLIGISLEASPQTDYKEGSAFVDAGMVLRLDYNNGTHEFVSDGWTISGYDPFAVGNQALTVSYGDFSLLLSVSVRAKTAISASLVTLPDRTVFLRGEALDPAGLSVLVEYDNGTSALFSQGWTLVGYDASTEGACNVTATVEGVSVIFTVTVKSPVPDRITSSVYRISDGVIRRVSVGTSVMHLLDDLNEMPYLKAYRNNASLNSQASVATGDTVRLEDGDRVKDSVIAVVTGDVNGDGVVSVTDLLMVKAHLLKKTSLTGIYSIAGDVSDDGSVSVTDFLQMKAFLLGTKNSFETK